MKRLAPFIRWAPLAATILLLNACACPPLSSSYEDPESTLASWQSHLCHDDAQGEYRCLSADLQASMGGFQTYIAARRALSESEPTLTWLLGRADLREHVVASDLNRVGRRARLTLEARGQRFELGFVQETAARIDLEDGRFLFAILRLPLEQLVGQQIAAGRVTRQWLELAEPRLAAGDLAQILSVHVEHRWKIDSIPGLLPTTGNNP